MTENRYFDFEDAPLEDFDSLKAGDEVAYEDVHLMFERYLETQLFLILSNH